MNGSVSPFFRVFHVGAEALQRAGQHAVVGQLIDDFVEAVGEVAAQRGLARSEVRLLRRLHLFIDVDAENVHLVFTNEASILASCKYFQHEEADPAHPLGMAIQAAISLNGFPEGSTEGFSLPRRLLECEGEERRERLKEMATIYVNEELAYLQAERGYVTFNPIFKRRGFLVDPTLCFVLMPFAQELQPIYEDHIRKAVTEAGLRALRADDIFSNREIIEDVWEYINRARVLVAELTGRNPNVYYEVGIAHTVGKDVILVTQSLDDVPFDLRHLRVVLYEYTPRGCDKLERDLVNTIRSVVSGHPVPPT